MGERASRELRGACREPPQAAMVEAILRAVRERRLSVEEAAKLLGEGHLPGGPHARFDLARTSRTGLPEVLLGEGKTLAHFVRLVEALHRLRQGVLLSRLTDEQVAELRRRARRGWPVRMDEPSRVAALDPDRLPTPLRGRTAALLTAGTADARVAGETAFLLESLGARVLLAFDVGVAGLHRLARALPRLRAEHPDLYIVYAGREGALATVVAGLVDRPVIGVPVAQGYGRGGGGEGALTSMLQSCAPLAVVNIDGGVPAALVAAQFLRQLPSSPAPPARPEGSGGRRHPRGSRSRG